MNKQKLRTYRSEAVSLLTLRMVLTDARKDVPPQSSKNDMSEELAAKLIKKMRRQYRRYMRLLA